MNLKDVKGIIFDLDGTLIKSKINFLEMKEKIIEYLNNLGLQPQLEAAKTSTLDLIEFINNRVKDKKLVKKILENVNKIMNEIELNSLTYIESINGVKEALEFLKSKEIKIGVLTRGCRDYALKSLKKTGLKNLIDYLVARDDVNEPKPNPTSALTLAKKMNLAPNEILMVGDHILDFLCAKKAGMKFIGVLTGFSSEKEFKKIGCTFIKSVNELPLFFK